MSFSGLSPIRFHTPAATTKEPFSPVSVAEAGLEGAMEQAGAAKQGVSNSVASVFKRVNDAGGEAAADADATSKQLFQDASHTVTDVVGEDPMGDASDAVAITMDDATTRVTDAVGEDPFGDAAGAMSTAVDGATTQVTEMVGEDPMGDAGNAMTATMDRATAGVTGAVGEDPMGAATDAMASTVDDASRTLDATTQEIFAADSEVPVSNPYDQLSAAMGSAETMAADAAGAMEAAVSDATDAAGTMAADASGMGNTMAADASGTADAAMNDSAETVSRTVEGFEPAAETLVEHVSDQSDDGVGAAAGAMGFENPFDAEASRQTFMDAMDTATTDATDLAADATDMAAAAGSTGEAGAGFAGEDFASAFMAPPEAAAEAAGGFLDDEVDFSAAFSAPADLPEEVGELAPPSDSDDLAAAFSAPAASANPFDDGDNDDDFSPDVTTVRSDAPGAPWQASPEAFSAKHVQVSADPPASPFDGENLADPYAPTTPTQDMSMSFVEVSPGASAPQSSDSDEFVLVDGANFPLTPSPSLISTDLSIGDLPGGTASEDSMKRESKGAIFAEDLPQDESTAEAEVEAEAEASEDGAPAEADGDEENVGFRRRLLTTAQSAVDRVRALTGPILSAAYATVEPVTNAVATTVKQVGTLAGEKATAVQDLLAAKLAPVTGPVVALGKRTAKAFNEKVIEAPLVKKLYSSYVAPLGGYVADKLQLRVEGEEEDQRTLKANLLGLPVSVPMDYASLQLAGSSVAAAFLGVKLFLGPCSSKK